MPVSPHADEEVFGKAYDGRLVRRLLHYVRPYLRGVIVAMTMLVLLTLFELAGPIIVKQAIDDAIANGRLERLDLYAAEYMAIIMAIFTLRFGQNYLLNRAGQLAMHDLPAFSLR